LRNDDALVEIAQGDFGSSPERRVKLLQLTKIVFRKAPLKQLMQTAGNRNFPDEAA
jgi:hypothetical protein